MSQRPIITLTTDFGLNDHFVGTIKGVIVDIIPDVQIVDICHSVQAFDVLDGALTIAQAYSYFPTGTVHLVVIDPGVGTERRGLVVSSDRHHFVAPDNGVLSLVYASELQLIRRASGMKDSEKEEDPVKKNKLAQAKPGEKEPEENKPTR